MSCHFPLHFRLSNYVRLLDWCLAAGKLRGTLGRVNNLFNMAAQSISSELSKCVRDLILLVEQGNFCEDDVAQFRLDWLYSAAVRYVDHIPSGEAVMNRLHQVAVLLATNKDDCRNSSVPIQAEVMLTGQRGRPRYSISKDKLEFLLDMKFTSVEIASMLCVSESTVKRRMRQYESYVRQRYSDFSDNDLDLIVERLMREFPNSGYKRMTGLLHNAGYRIQQNRIRESMRRVNPDGVLLRALELRAVRRRRYQVPGPLALWDIDGNQIDKVQHRLLHILKSEHLWSV